MPARPHRDQQLADVYESIVEACAAGLDIGTFRTRVLGALRRAVTVDAVWWATVDPATALFTGAYSEELPAASLPYFLENEFGAADVNRWTDVAQLPGAVTTLTEATGGALEQSPRLRDVFAPLGLGDELRAVLIADGSRWGYMCLHREVGAPFGPDEVALMRRIAPHIARAMRTQTVRIESAPAGDREPGVVVLDRQGTVVTATAGGVRWLALLGGDTASPPLAVRAVAAAIRTAPGNASPAPRMSVPLGGGRFAALHAAPLDAADEERIAVVIEAASPPDVAPVLMAAYGLTERERIVTMLVCQGWATTQIAVHLHLSPHTVQDHMKSIFAKTGVGNRRQLAAALLERHYLGASV